MRYDLDMVIYSKFGSFSENNVGSLKEFFFDYSIQKAICTSLITREEDNNERMYKNILVPFGFFSFFLKLMDETFTFI